MLFQDGKWDAEKVIDVPSKKVDGWALPEMPGKNTNTSEQTHIAKYKLHNLHENGRDFVRIKSGVIILKLKLCPVLNRLV